MSDEEAARDQAIVARAGQVRADVVGRHPFQIVGRGHEVLVCAGQVLVRRDAFQREANPVGPFVQVAVDRRDVLDLAHVAGRVDGHELQAHARAAVRVGGVVFEGTVLEMVGIQADRGRQAQRVVGECHPEAVAVGVAGQVVGDLVVRIGQPEPRRAALEDLAFVDLKPVGRRRFANHQREIAVQHVAALDRVFEEEGVPLDVLADVVLHHHAVGRVQHDAAVRGIPDRAVLHHVAAGVAEQRAAVGVAQAVPMDRVAAGHAGLACAPEFDAVDHDLGAQVHDHQVHAEAFGSPCVVVDALDHDVAGEVGDRRALVQHGRRGRRGRHVRRVRGQAHAVGGDVLQFAPACFGDAGAGGQAGAARLGHREPLGLRHAVVVGRRDRKRVAGLPVGGIFQHERVRAGRGTGAELGPDRRRRRAVQAEAAPLHDDAARRAIVDRHGRAVQRDHGLVLIRGRRAADQQRAVHFDAGCGERQVALVERERPFDAQRAQGRRVDIENDRAPGRNDDLRTGAGKRTAPCGGIGPAQDAARQVAR